MADAKVEVLFELNSRLKGINDAIDRVQKAERKTKLYNKSLFSMRKGMLNAGKAAGALGVAGGVAAVGLTGAFGKKAFDSFAKFEKSMKGVEAILAPTTKQLRALEKEALRLGRTTQFTSTEAAEGIEILAKNGVKTEAILSGVLEASLALAASTGAGLTESADTLTDVLAIFEISAEDASEAVDQINGVTINSKFAFDDYAAAIANGASSAVAAGQSFEDFNAGIAATANFFANGEQSGTSYKAFMKGLTKDNKKAQLAVKKLGLTLKDQDGNFTNIADLAGQLSTAFDRLNPAERAKAFQDLFDARGKNFAIALARSGSEGIKTAEALIKFANAADQAETRIGGSAGSVLKLEAAYENLLITFGKPVAEKVTPIIDALTSKIAIFAEDQERVDELVNSFFETIIVGGANALDVLKGISEIFTTLQSASLGLEGIKLEGTVKFKENAARLQGNRIDAFAGQAGQSREEFVNENFDTPAVQQYLSVVKGLAQARFDSANHLERIAEFDEAKKLSEKIPERAEIIALWEDFQGTAEESRARLDELRDAKNALNTTSKELADTELSIQASKGDEKEELEAKRQALLALGEAQAQQVEKLIEIDKLNKGDRSGEDEAQKNQLLSQRIELTNQEATALKAVVAEKENLVGAFAKAGDETIKASDATKTLASETKANVSTVSESIETLPETAQRSADGVKEALSGTKEAFDPITQGATETAETAESAMPRVTSAISSMASTGSEQISTLNTAFDGLQSKMRETTTAGQKFENDAVKNSWLKDMVLVGIAYLNELVDDGFSPLGRELETITKAGEAVSLEALQKFNEGAPEKVGSVGDSFLGAGANLVSSLFNPIEAGGAVNSKDSEIEAINAEHAERREAILANERQTATEKNDLLLGLERDKAGAFAELDQRVNADRAANLESTLGRIQSLTQSSNKTLFRIGKAAAIAQATIDGVRGVQTALGSAAPPFNFILAGLVGAASAVNIAKIASQKPPQFFEGGTVNPSGGLANSDDTFAKVASGEEVINNRAASSNRSLLKFINRNGRGVDLSAQLQSLPSATPPSATPPSVQNTVNNTSFAPQATAPDVNVFNDIDALLDAREAQFESRIIDSVKARQSEIGIEV